MIEALERYAEKYDIEDKTNFYLAKDGMIKSDDKHLQYTERLNATSHIDNTVTFFAFRIYKLIMLFIEFYFSIDNASDFFI
jgi:hypothetical protein